MEPRVKYTRVQPHDTRVKYFNNRPSVPPRYKRSPQDEEDKNLGKVMIKLDNFTLFTNRVKKIEVKYCVVKSSSKNLSFIVGTE